MIRKFFLLILGCFVFVTTKGQIYQPVAWRTLTRMVSQNIYDVIIVARMEEDWHIYSQLQPEGAISTPTTIRFNKSTFFGLENSIREVGTKIVQDIPDLGIKQYYFSDSVRFIQRVKKLKPGKVFIKGTITFMACTNKQCLPEDEVTFNVVLPE